MAKTINNWCPQGIVHSVQMDCSFRRNDGKNDNRSNRNGTTLLALDCQPQGQELGGWVMMIFEIKIKSLSSPEPCL